MANTNVKIITTLGPSSSSFPVLKRMKKNGADIARINTKYGNENEWNELLQDSKKLGFEIMIDIIGTNALNWVNTNEIDYVAVSFANSKHQINKIRKKINNP